VGWQGMGSTSVSEEHGHNIGSCTLTIASRLIFKQVIGRLIISYWLIVMINKYF
jgi:hypothetical protein